MSATPRSIADEAPDPVRFLQPGLDCRELVPNSLLTCFSAN